MNYFLTQCRSSRRRASDFLIEPLEGRTHLSISIQLDYSHDDSNFFANAERRSLFQMAADTLGARLGDQLSAIEPGGGNTWTASLSDPSDVEGTIDLDNPTIPANTIRIFVGADQIDALAIGGPGVGNATGTSQWRALVNARGQSNVDGTSARDFGPYGGTITFDSDPDGGWYFGLDANSIGTAVDFYSVAVHEIGHVLGMGISDSWDSQLFGSTFRGPSSVAAYDDGGNVPVNDGRDHWAQGTKDNGLETAMEPDLANGQRKLFAPLDYAGLDDIGWEIPIAASLSTPTSIASATASNARFKVNYAHYADISGSSLSDGDLTVTGPNGYTGTALFISDNDRGESVEGTYAFQPPGGTFDASDAGVYTVTVNSGAVTDAYGNSTIAGVVGTLTLEVDAGPTGALSADNVTRIGGGTHPLSVTYNDSTGIQDTTIDTSDLIVTRASDGLALSVISATIGEGSTATEKTVTYLVQAPGGLWDVSDNGTYNVSLVGSQVADATGNVSDAAVLGSFDVAITGRQFSSGSDLVFTDATGDPVVISLKGPGSAQAFFDTTGDADVSEIIFSNTGLSTSLTVTAGGAGSPIGGMTVNGSLKSVTFKNADLAGPMDVTGTVPKLGFRNASGSISLAGDGAPVTITLAQAVDLSITSAVAIKSIKAVEWLDNDVAPDVITTPALTALAVKGALGAGIRADTIGKITAGRLNGSEIRTTGNIASITATSAAASTIFAGVRTDVLTLPDSADDFANPGASIASITFKGKTPGSFSNTLVAAGVLGKVSLGTITSANGGVSFGAAGLSMKSASGTTDSTGAFKKSKLDDPTGSLVAGDFNLRVL